MNKGEGMESVAGRGTLVINIDWNVEQREGAEEDHHVKILLESLRGENTLNDSFNFEELSSFVKGVSEATQDSDSLVSTHGGLRALLATDKIAGFERLISQYGKLFHQIAYNVLYSYDLAQDAVSEAYTKIYYY